ncbi:hypothetical protein C8R46DRAFT_1231447 [Mycena filopes]|nr:hypothetical protein C8R46DRAFT_1231447 [Mycena filopes]
MPYGGLVDVPLLEEDEAEDNASGRWGWLLDSNAGGMILPFPQYEGQPMHSVNDIPYLRFCAGRTKREDFVQAFERYHAGLLHLVEKDDYSYECFRVPFGKKHRGEPGTPLRKCRDQRWFRWCSKQAFLTEKHPIFFIAVRRWLANPQKFEHTRDIGKLLTASEYADGLNLSAEGYDLSHEFDEEDADGNLAGFVVADSMPMEEAEDSQLDSLDEHDAHVDRFQGKKRKRNKSKQRRRSIVRNANLGKRPAVDDAESSDFGDAPARKKPTRKPSSAKKSKPRKPTSTKKSKLKRKRPTSDSEGIEPFARTLRQT